MNAVSKRWAIASGFLVVAGAAVVQIAASRFHESNPLTGALSFLNPQEPSTALAPAPGPASAVTPAPAPTVQPGARDAAQTVPQFDVVRVEPTGGTVVAGQGAPDSTVALLSSGKTIGEAKTDSSGHFALVPSELPPGGTTLTLRQTAGGVNVDSRQSVAVSVPGKGGDKKDLVVALAEPGQATKLLAAPQPAAILKPAAALAPPATPLKLSVAGVGWNAPGETAVPVTLILVKEIG